MSVYKIYKKWESLGVLSDLNSETDQIALALILDKAARYYISLDLPFTEVQNITSSIIFPTLVRVFIKHAFVDYFDVIDKLTTFIEAHLEIIEEFRNDAHVDIEGEMIALFTEEYKGGLFTKTVEMLKL